MMPSDRSAELNVSWCYWVDYTKVSSLASSVTVRFLAIAILCMCTASCLISISVASMPTSVFVCKGTDEI
jgi:hypothetical protein